MFWEVFGLNWFDLERLPYSLFRAWVKALDKVEKERERQAREAKRGR